MRFGYPSGLDESVDENIKNTQRVEVTTAFNEFHQAWLKLKTSLDKYILPDEKTELERVGKQINISIDFLADLTD